MIRDAEAHVADYPLLHTGYSDLILELYGPDIGKHARSSIGMALPLNAPVLCEAEVEIDSHVA
jgi:hypothetical protein